MAREEIAQLHKALQESNEAMKKLKELAHRQLFTKTKQYAIEKIEQNKAAMEILNKEYKLTYLPYHGHKGNFNEDKS